MRYQLLKPFRHFSRTIAESQCNWQTVRLTHFSSCVVGGMPPDIHPHFIHIVQRILNATHWKRFISLRLFFKHHFCLSFFVCLQEPLDEQLRSPNCLLVDFAKLESPLQVHLCFIALDHFLATRSMLPKPRLVNASHTNFDCESWSTSSLISLAFKCWPHPQ